LLVVNIQFDVNENTTESFKRNYGSKIELTIKIKIMKNKNLLKWVTAGLLIILCVTSTISYSQTRSRKLSNGTVVFSDGTIKRADGTVKFPDGRVRQVDGSIKYPDGTVRYPGNNNGTKQALPPGQAKKIYGTRSARPFAPGQQKKKVFTNGSKGKGKGKK
jgi:hypothetical protein